jgi:hypothetical protein
LIHAFAEGELESGEGGLGYGGGIMIPGIARNATFAASITVDCQIASVKTGVISRRRNLELT